MPNEFPYDVFLSHSAKDKAVVRPLAERFRQDGLKVWFDEWVLKPGDSIPAKIEGGLEHSRVLVLCMSAHAFGSDWAQLEAGTFRFRDPLNQERRFIPLRLDDAPIKGSLAQFLYINWLPTDREQEYARLLDACLKPAERPTQPQELETPSEGRIIFAHDDSVYSIAITPDGRWLIADTVRSRLKKVRLDPRRESLPSRDAERQAESAPLVRGLSVTPDGKHIVSSSSSPAVQVWRLGDMKRIRAFRFARRPACCVGVSPDGTIVVAGSYDGTIGVWDFNTGEPIRVINAHSMSVKAVVVSPDGRSVISASEDRRIGVWDIATGENRAELMGHSDGVITLVLTHDGTRLVSGSHDKTIRVWDMEHLRCNATLEGHTHRIFSLAMTRDDATVVSASSDKTIRVWDLKSKVCFDVLRGHSKSIRSVCITPNDRWIVSASVDGTVRVWPMRRESFRRTKAYVYGPVVHVEMEGSRVAGPLTRTEKQAFAPDQVQYTNAKVLLVGESGVGKTGLSNRLALEKFEATPSTDGAWATHWPLKHDRNKASVEREVWLWDFAGQVDYRLVHQLFMDDTAAAVLVFNPQNENPFEGLGHWDRDLQKAARKPFAKLLAAARIDRGGLVVSAASMEKFMKERGILGPLHVTSAKTGEGCDALREAILQAIDWKSIPETTSPALYHRLKQEILSLRDSGLVLIRLAELKQRMEMTLRNTNFELAELEAVVGLLAGPGMIQRLDFGGFILLRPEVLSRYAAAVVRKVRKHPQELGCIREDELLAGDLDYQDFKRLSREDEAVVLRTLLETFVSRAWCLRQPCEGTALLTFPSYFRRERKEQPSHPSVLVTYRFDGPADDIYATLVVRLHHTVAFQSTDLWKSAADFKTQLGAKLGFTLLRASEGTSRLEVYFEPDVDGNSRVLFLRYVHDHLMQHAQNVVRLRRYYCEDKTCDSAKEPFPDQVKIAKALAPGGKGKVFCPDCGKPILLRDVIEEKFESPAVKEQVREMQSEAQVVLDNESRELILVGHAFAIVAEAGQIYRGYSNSDHGIDGEIEFKDDQGRASGKRLYMQLKSGDSYLKKRERDGAEVFQIKYPRWGDYWQRQAYAVMLVIRTSDGEIRWMDVSAYLKEQQVQNPEMREKFRQIVFTGERFDAASVRQLRDRVLGGKAP